MLFLVLGVCFAHDGLQRTHDFALRDFLVCSHDVAVFQSARRLHYRAVAYLESYIVRSKIIYLAHRSEFNAYYLRHLYLSSNIFKTSSSATTAKFPPLSVLRLAYSICPTALAAASGE